MNEVPEFPDITVYIEALASRIVEQPIDSLKLNSPFLLRTAVPDIALAAGQPVIGLRRMGKRIVMQLPDDRALVFHLMIAGRLHWYRSGAKVPAKAPLCLLQFPTGTLTLTEAGSKKRAALHFLEGQQALDDLDPAGLEIFDASLEQFARRLQLNNHTLKRALTSPRIFSGIGNAYSDEILHKARLSPVLLTQKMQAESIERLYHACREVLAFWTDELRQQAGERFPEKVTAFRKGMAVHGRYREPCPECGTAIQRIRYVGNETNYCPRCQTGGKLLADRALSRLLKKDWPKSIEELEQGRS